MSGYTFPDINDTTGKGYLLQGMIMHSIVLTGVHSSPALYDFSKMKWENNRMSLIGLNSSFGGDILFKY